MTRKSESTHDVEETQSRESALAGVAVGEHAAVILDSITDGVFTVDSNFVITSFNHAAEQITGTSRDQAIGQSCCDVFRANICEEACALRHTMSTGNPVVNKAVYIVNSRGSRVPISISTALLKDKRGKVIGGVETFRDLSVVEELRKELAGSYAFTDIISKSHQMHELFEILPQVAESDSTVVIQGESGTGKELFARAVHKLSRRKEKPLVTVNCGALPETLLESELFGYRAGAFTGAVADKRGRFAVAEGGTLFLDEIGDISFALQVKLLRFLQERTYEPLGAADSVQADVRIIAATNRDLDALVQEGRFRSDLYYRINVVRLVLPPLRERKEDIPLLIDHFINHFNRMRSRDVAGVSPDSLRILMEHKYPGNIRELQNIVEHAFVLCSAGLIDVQHLPDYLRPTRSPLLSVGATLEEVETRLIADAIERNNGNRLAAARELGIHKSTLFRKIKSLGIIVPEKDGRSRS